MLILTVTLNPSVDISYRIESFSLDTTNRVEDVSKTAGGKGLNVTRVIQQLGQDVAATGFLGGSLGSFIHSELSILGIRDMFVNIEGETRNCIAIIHKGKQTEVLESGPTISDNEGDLFLERFTNDAREASIVTISGSLPKGLADNYYNRMLKVAKMYDIPVLLDTKGDLLARALHNKEKPYLIKPNQEELADLKGGEVVHESEIIETLKTEPFNDVPWVVVTLGAEGAIVKRNHKLYRVTAPRVRAINPVGSGDSVIAGFAAGLSKKLPDVELIKFGLAMGVLNAMEEKTGYIDPVNVEWCVGKMEVREILL
jgi:tagatose 6-phosphate kinase